MARHIKKMNTNETLVERLYDVMTAEELTHEAEISDNRLAKMLVKRYAQMSYEINDHISTNDELANELSDLEDANSALESELQEKEGRIEEIEADLAEVKSNHNTLLSGISSLVTRGTWEPNGDGGFDLQQYADEHEFPLEASLFHDFETDLYYLTINPTGSELEDKEFEADTAEEAKEAATLHIINYVALNGISE